MGWWLCVLLCTCVCACEILLTCKYALAWDGGCARCCVRAYVHVEFCSPVNTPWRGMVAVCVVVYVRMCVCACEVLLTCKYALTWSAIRCKCASLGGRVSYLQGRVHVCVCVSVCEHVYMCACVCVCACVSTCVCVRA